MADKRQLELYLLRLLLYALRDDFVTLGFVLLESDGGFAEVRFTRDWKMLRCVAPNVEWEWFGMVESDIRGKLGRLQGREELVDYINERFGTMIEVAPAKAVLTDDPVKEMELLTAMYLVPVERSERARQRSGRAGIVDAMEEAFSRVGVLELLQRDLALSQYTAPGDLFQVDFGYRVGSVMKMFHAVSVAASADHPLALSIRFPLVDAGMRREQLQPSLTAVFDQTLGLTDERMQFAIGMLEQNSVRVRTVAELAQIADEVKRELRA